MRSLQRILATTVMSAMFCNLALSPLVFATDDPVPQPPVQQQLQVPQPDPAQQPPQAQQQFFQSAPTPSIPANPACARYVGETREQLMQQEAEINSSGSFSWKTVGEDALMGAGGGALFGLLLGPLAGVGAVLGGIGGAIWGAFHPNAISPAAEQAKQTQLACINTAIQYADYASSNGNTMPGVVTDPQAQKALAPTSYSTAPSQLPAPSQPAQVTPNQ